MGGISRVRGVIGRVLGGSGCHPWCPFGINRNYQSPQPCPQPIPSAIPGSACSGCRSGAGARSSQGCRGQRQTAATPALQLRLSLHKVRLRRPLRRLVARLSLAPPPAIRRSRSESRVGFCAMASRSARVWGGTPVWIAARTCKPCALRTGKARTCTLSSKHGIFVDETA